MRPSILISAFALATAIHQSSHAETTSKVMEIACGIGTNGVNLNCTVLGKDKHIMNPEEIAEFIDTAQTGEVYVTMKSSRAIDRILKIDGKAPQFSKIRDVTKNGSISQISEAKLALWSELEKKMIKVSDELDRKVGTAELVLPDAGRTFEKAKDEAKVMRAELESYRKNSDSLCTTTPAYEQVTKTNTHLQKALSNLIYAFQNPGSCMQEYRVFKDREGSVDLGQLNAVSDFYKSNCVTRKR